MPSHADADHGFPSLGRHILAVKWNDRWQIYHRLSALGIRCWCSPYQPLQVEIPSPAAAIQLWSVVRQLTISAQDQARWLNNCWNVSPAKL